MLRRIARLFTIKTRLEACAVIYALALGSVMRGAAWLETWPGAAGLLLFAACLAAVVMAGARLLEVTRPTAAAAAQPRRVRVRVRFTPPG
jgi:hypothetical protein